MKYFISDLHFEHSRLLGRSENGSKARPFSSIEKYNEYMMGVINDTCGRSDNLYILGDFCFKHKELYFRRQIKCKHLWFVFGNHDHKNRIKAAFGEQRCSDILCSHVYKMPVVMCHYPMLYWPGSQHGHFHLHGHVHDQRSLYIQAKFPKAKILDVSPDSHYRIFGTWGVFSEDKVWELLKDRRGHDDVAYYKQYQLTHYLNREDIC